MGCVSSKTTDESKDPPVEKDNNNAAPSSIPEIQINGPSKEAEVSSKSSNNVCSEPQKSPPSPAEGKEPLFPHVSPFKPQFDFHKDVALSPKSGRYDECSGGGGKRNDDGSLMDSLGGGFSEHNSLQRTSQGGGAVPAEAVPRAKGECAAVISPARTSAKSLDIGSPSTPDNTSPRVAGPDDVQLEERSRQPVGDESSSLVEESKDAADDKPQPPAAAQPSEDRTAILSSFLQHQSGPEVAVDDAECVIVKPDHNTVEPGQAVEDEELAPETAALPDDPAANGDVLPSHTEAGGAASAALKRHTEDGNVAPLSDEDRKKLNDFLNSIETIHEKQLNNFEVRSGGGDCRTTQGVDNVSED